jgi:rhomboid protease GluP
MSILQEQTSTETPPPNPATRHTGVVTTALIVLNVAVFVVMAIATQSLMDPSSQNLIKWGADYGPLTLNGQWWRLITCMFVHIGVIHLVFNMYVLANIGFFMEAVLGRPSYFALYMVSGLGSSAASLWWHPNTVSAGASGAIFGLYGGLLAFLLLNLGVIPLEALGSLAKGAIIFIGYNVVYSLSQPDVDLAAHVGGLVTGFLVGLVLVVPVVRLASPNRGPRLSVAAVFGIGIMVVTMVALPKPGDLLAELDRLAKVEKAATDRFNASIEKSKAGKLTDQQFADVLEKEIIPPWRSERETFSKLQNLPGKQATIADSLVHYMQLREESWTLLLEGLHTQNSNKIQQANQKATEAVRVAEQSLAAAKH